jgi:predicted amidohydrolase
MKIRVGQVKVFPKKGCLRENADLLMSVLGQIAPLKPDVVVTPEGFLDGYVSTEKAIEKENMPEYAIDPAVSLYSQAVGDWARGNRSWVVFGCARLAPEGVYNSALVFNRDGSLAGSYDKTHLQCHDLKYVPGSRIPVFESDFGLFGVLICADRRWPETVRTLALKGARVIFNPTYGMSGEKNLWMMRTRSYESEIFIVFTHPRQALITSPTGEVVCNNEDEKAAYAVTEIDLSEVERIREAPMAHLKDRRPDIYAL